MRISICEDTELDLEYLISYLKRYGECHNLEIEIFTFKRADKFLENLKNNDYDLFFLDIFLEWDGQNGISLAHKIQEKKGGDIVFTTTSREYAVESYEIGAIHYLVKPYTYAQLEQAMKRSSFVKRRTEKKIALKKIGSTVIEIPQSEIIYMESFDRILIIHTREQEIETYQRLSTVYEMLDKNLFIRPQRSYIVNLEYVLEIKNKSFIMTDGKEITIPRRAFDNVCAQYHQYLFCKAREN